MARTVGLLAIAACLFVAIQGVLLCLATGGRMLTRFPDPRIEHMIREEIRRQIVLPDEPTTLPPMDNSFALGWLPSGFSREGLSVVSIALPCVFAAVVLAWSSATRRQWNADSSTRIPRQ